MPQQLPRRCRRRQAPVSTLALIRVDIYELRVDGDKQAYRLLFATEGRQSQVLLALEAFSKKIQKTPPARRLADWRARANSPLPVSIDRSFMRG